MKVVGIGGGSGSGKTTVSWELAARYPDRFEVLTLDDYQKPVDDPSMPRVDNMINWDHPSVILWQNLRRHIAELRNGQEVHTTSWAHRSVAGIKEPRVLVPREIVIVEGYLALHEMRDVYDIAAYFDLDEVTRYERRRQARGRDDTEPVEDPYRVKILNPMHELYVEPTKANANVVIDVGDKSPSEIASAVLALIES
jgi:uridine kinase